MVCKHCNREVVAQGDTGTLHICMSDELIEDARVTMMYQEDVLFTCRQIGDGIIWKLRPDQVARYGL